MVSGLALSGALMMAAQPAPAEDEVLHLLQLAVPIGEETVGAFTTVTRAIRSCENAREIGRMLSAEIVENRSVPLSILPEPVRVLLRDLPIGQATPVFGNETTTMKVLVICARQPAQDDGTSPT
jgi:hypothetical protein